MVDGVNKDADLNFKEDDTFTLLDPKNGSRHGTWKIVDKNTIESKFEDENYVFKFNDSGSTGI